MNYVGIISDGAVAGRSLAMFILETERRIEEKELWEDKQCQKSWDCWESLRDLKEFEIHVLALDSATEFLDRAGSRLLNYTSW